MNFDVGDKVKCIKDLIMDDDGKIEFTTGKLYVIDDILSDRYYLFDNSNIEHEMGDDDFFGLYFEAVSTLTSEQRFDRAMGTI